MGEGHYRPQDAITRHCDPFDDIDPDDAITRLEAWEDLIGLVHAAAGPRAWKVERSWWAWRDRHARVVARTGLHDITLYENSYSTVFVSVWPRDDLAANTEALAQAGLARTAAALFRRLSRDVALRIATSAWTSARWVPAPGGERGGDRAGLVGLARASGERA